MTRIKKWLPKLALMATTVMALSATASAAEKPNILVIFGDDIGQTNISAYSMGVVGYKGKSRPVKCPTRCSRAWTGSLPCWPRLATMA